VAAIELGWLNGLWLAAACGIENAQLGESSAKIRRRIHMARQPANRRRTGIGRSSSAALSAALGGSGVSLWLAS